MILSICERHQKDSPITQPPTTVTLSRVTDFVSLGVRWRALEAGGCASFFQSWTWVGCLAAERFSDPMLLCASEDGRDVALALLNRSNTRLARDTLLLNETGEPGFDAMFVEHNGIVFAKGYENLLAACLRCLLRPEHSDRLILSGVGGSYLAAARGTGAVLRVLRTEPSPFIDFTYLPPGPDAYLAALSTNTRYQLRRSARRYATLGPLLVERATTTERGFAILDELAGLHQATWTARGRAGAFANPKFRLFHRALIERGLPRDEIDLLRVTAGDRLIGCLYNFRRQGRVMTYQSGFAYAESGAHQKPGLTTHHMAIETYRAAGATRYDFLAGEDRYKTSLSNDATILHWIDLVPRWSPRGVATRAQRVLWPSLLEKADRSVAE
jgi:CelD/BcsL family acetyltransferase involved in cellulose biosynthesis